MSAKELATPSQTVGPFFRLGLDSLTVADLTKPAVAGRPITIRGIVLDGDGQPVTNALIETWQADAAGHYPGRPASLQPADPSTTSAVRTNGSQVFKGFGRVATDDAGRFELRTIVPGPTPGPQGEPQAPHLAVAIFMRGLLKHLVTRIYFGDDATISHDPVLNMVDQSRRSTLLATPHAGTPGVYDWKVCLQGPEETVFFDI